MVRFGTLGVANITPRALIYPCLDEPQANVVAVAARDVSRARNFARHAGIRHTFETYQAVLDCDEVDAIYIPLPISHHKEWVLKSLEAGKHVLCEKSFALNAEEAEVMAAAGAKTDRVVMDAYHYRYHPLFNRAKEIVETGELGEIQQINASFHIDGKHIPADNIRMNYELGGGVTMDIGCYPISWARHLLGSEPVAVEASAEVGAPNIDLSLESTLSFPDGVTAKTSGSMQPGADTKALIIVSGTEGSMRVENPLLPQTGHQLVLNTNGRTRVETFDRRATYAYQLDAFLMAINEGHQPITDAVDAVKQMEVIDRCYEAAGLPRRGENVTT